MAKSAAKCGKTRKNAGLRTASAAAVLSVMPWVVFGADYVSGVGVGITSALLLAAICLALSNRGGKTAKNPEKELDFP